MGEQDRPDTSPSLIELVKATALASGRVWVDADASGLRRHLPTPLPGEALAGGPLFVCEPSLPLGRGHVPDVLALFTSSSAEWGQ